MVSLVVFASSVYAVPHWDWVSWENGQYKGSWIHIGETKVIFRVSHFEECKFLMEQNGCDFCSYNIFTQECKVFITVFA